MKKTGLITLLALLLLLTQSGIVQADSAQKKKYISSVVSVLRSHAQMLQQLSNHEFKYSENLARHAKSIQRTFGLVGPMDWHAAKSAKIAKRANHSQTISAEDFERMAQRSTKSIKKLYTAAHSEVKDGKKGSVLDALDQMQRKCEECHTLLPKGTAPDVWNLAVAPGQ
jgi:hypothetical protein